jgi:glycolate oxidase iron-sulfur subunit
MRAVSDGDLPVGKAFAGEMDYCLGCLACTTACPAGVDYGTLFEASRAQAEAVVPRGAFRALIRFASLRLLLARPRLLHAAARLLRAVDRSGLRALARKSGLFRILPKRLGELERQALPISSRFSDELIAPVEGAGARRVAVLTGCIQDIAFADINRATVDVLVANGCTVVTPRPQGCCGSLHAHNGDPRASAALARALIDSVDEAPLDAIISNSAGCGSHLKRYGHLLKDDPAYAVRAARWSAKVRDVSEYLVEIGFRRPKAPSGGAGRLLITYHEACHLCHGQRITAQPREILRAIPGAELRELADSALCCGSAGVYSLTQPETSGWLRSRKTANILATGASVVATANPGCQLQIEQGLRAEGASLSVQHPVTLLAAAYRRES